MTRDPFAVEIGRRIRAAREHKRWSATELARRAGWDVRRVNNYEMGERMPGPEDVLRMATLLGDSPAFLMNLVPHQDPQKTRNLEEESLLELYRLVDPEARIRVMESLEAMALLKRHAIEDERVKHMTRVDRGRAAASTGRK